MKRLPPLLWRNTAAVFVRFPLALASDLYCRSRGPTGPHLRSPSIPWPPFRRRRRLPQSNPLCADCLHGVLPRTRRLSAEPAPHELQSTPRRRMLWGGRWAQDGMGTVGTKQSDTRPTTAVVRAGAAKATTGGRASLHARAGNDVCLDGRRESNGARGRARFYSRSSSPTTVIFVSVRNFL